jgi:uncharacterized protein involved in exopolysaccharide biosynthesis
MLIKSGANCIASKCRQKKKLWMQELETKSAEIFQRNRELLAMNNQLKDELQQLKQRLMTFESQCRCGVHY